jgi:hypothetical protein
MKLSMLFVFVTCIGAIPATLRASIQSMDWENAGDGLLTLDTTTGYRWLDLTETQGMSFNQVLTQLDVGGDYEGFNVASTAQLQAFFQSGGWTGHFNVNFDNDIVRYNEARSIVDLIGETTQAIASVYATYGMVANVDSVGSHFYNNIYSAVLPDRINASSFHNLFSLSPDNYYDHIGVFLYQSPDPVSQAPEPFSLLVWGGLIVGGLIVRYGARPRKRCRRAMPTSPRPQWASSANLDSDCSAPSNREPARRSGLGGIERSIVAADLVFAELAASGPRGLKSPSV